MSCGTSRGQGMGLGLDGEERVRAEIAAQLQHSDFANISSLAWEFLTDGRRYGAPASASLECAPVSASLECGSCMSPSADSSRAHRSAHVETPATRGDWDDMTEGELEQELEARGVSSA
eukprot:2238608-Rhodomonas_salina.1